MGSGPPEIVGGKPAPTAGAPAAFLRPVAALLFSRAFLVGLVLAGVALRFASALLTDLAADSDFYLGLGRDLARTGGYPHREAPLWPLVLGSAFAVGGYSIALAKAVSLAVGLALLPVTYAATRDLYGGDCALAVTATLAVFPQLILDVGRVYTENLTMLLFVLVLWAILKSLRERRHIVPAGLFAGLTYLARTSLGVFVLVTVVSGILWRFHYMRFGLFRDRHYLVAGAIFAALVGGWNLRNRLAPAGPAGSVTDSVLSAMSDASTYLFYLAAMTFFLALLLLSFAIYVVPELRRSLRRIGEEEESGLWFGVVMVPATAVFIVAAFAQLEVGDVPLFWRDRIRYIVFAFYPLLLLPLRDFRLPARVPRADPPAPRPPAVLASRRRWALAALALALAAFSAAFVGLWLVPLFALAVPAAFVRGLHGRLLALLLALLLLSVETGTSSQERGAQAAIRFVADRGGTSVAVAASLSVRNAIATYAGDLGIEVVDPGGSPAAPFLVTENASAAFPGYALEATFHDTYREGLVQGLLERALGRPTERQKVPLYLHRLA